MKNTIAPPTPAAMSQHGGRSWKQQHMWQGTCFSILAADKPQWCLLGSSWSLDFLSMTHTHWRLRDSSHTALTTAPRSGGTQQFSNQGEHDSHESQPLPPHSHQPPLEPTTDRMKHTTPALPRQGQLLSYCGGSTVLKNMSDKHAKELGGGGGGLGILVVPASIPSQGGEWIPA